jgi:predicted MPP superfamily phosphohydrolase
MALLHGGLIAWRGAGLSGSEAVVLLAAIGAANVCLLPWVRRRIRSRGLVRVVTRAWIFGSIGALFSGTLLAATFTVGTLVGAAGPQGGAGFAWAGAACVALGFGSVAWGASIGSWRVRVDRVRLAWPGPPLRIAHVTDLHIGPLLEANRLARFVERINRIDADLVVLTGDLFDFDPDYVEQGCRALAGLRARRGVFAVLGNHDVFTGVEVVAEGLARHTEIRVLRDAWERVECDDDAIAIAGVEDPGIGWRERESRHAALDELAASLPEGLPCLLLAHRPSWFAHAAEHGIPLVLAGHTHGGQVALPFAKHLNPSRVIADRTRGLFRLGQSTLYVSRGLGMAGLPLRLNCPREIALIELSPTPRRRQGGSG